MVHQLRMQKPRYLRACPLFCVVDAACFIVGSECVLALLLTMMHVCACGTRGAHLYHCRLHLSSVVVSPVVASTRLHRNSNVVRERWLCWGGAQLQVNVSVKRGETPVSGPAPRTEDTAWSNLLINCSLRRGEGVLFY